jgi:DNA polymerase-3 subunit epsilon/ATP-dependent DNA helicase DinG
VLDGGGALVVEAGTGTGKSLAYLVPALRAAGRGLRVLVSTRTTTLQDQLAASDLPRLVRAFGVDVSAAVLKGRANYLCPRRWHLFRLSATTSDEARFAMKTLVWRERTRTGDRAELNLQGGGEHLAWSRVCAEDETCTARRCALVRGGCYLERARDRAAHADLVVANHALLLSDAARSNRLLPDVDVVIADEAHHLDEVASRVFGVDVTAADLRRAVQRVAQSAAAVRPDADLTALRDLAQLALVAIEETFVALARVMADPSERGYEDQRRITAALRSSEEWLVAEVAAERLRDGLAAVEREARGVLGAWEDPAPADAAAELQSAVAELRALDAGVGRVVHLPERGEICWLALAPGGALALRSAPAHAGAYIDRAFARGRHAAVFTSATLAVAGSFAFVMDRFGLGDRAASLRVGSGFDYHRQALLVLPTGLPDPFEPAFVDRVAAAVAAVGGALAGRTLVLFTSHSMLRAVHARIAGWGEEERIAVLAQSLGGSRRQLLEQFAAGRAVLLGTSTFWEGIDLPGDLLRCVVIAKLPFPVPDDPLVAGRSERYEDPFRDYHLPLAALRLRQGFGRLIRSRDDRGAVVLLDRRLTSRTYGETFLRSLPDCEIVRADVAALGQTVARWCDAGKDGRRLD